MTLKNFTLTIAALAALFTPVAAEAQVTLTQTTLAAQVGAAAGNTGTSCFSLTSATGVSAPAFNSPNVPTGNQTELYTDKELMLVTSVSGTYVCALRGYGGTKAKAHASGTTVYVGPPAYFSNNEQAGYCVGTQLQQVPVINVETGHIFSCGDSHQWAQVLNGTQTGSPSGTISFLCSGPVGSAETEYISSTVACSGSTTELLRWTATTAGTVANLRVSSSANFLGTGGAIFTVRKNAAVVTGFTCAPTAATKVCANMLPGFTDAGTVGAVDSVAVAAGDTIDVSFLTSTSDTAANLSVQLSVY